MTNSVEKISYWIEKFNYLLYFVGGISILIASFILTYEVFMRYFFKFPSHWEIEFAVYLGVMAAFLGAAYGLKDDAHIGIDIVTTILPPKIRDGLVRVTSFISLLFCFLITYYSWIFWWEAYSYGWRSTSVWGPPLAIPYFFLPMGMTLLTLQFIIQIFRLRQLKKQSS